MKKLNKKGLGILYGVALFSFSTYALLDTFVIPHPMQSVMASNVVAETTNSSIRESVEEIGRASCRERVCLYV